MADSPFRVTDSFTGEQMEFKNYDAYIAYMDKKNTSASKTAKKPAKRESIQKMKTQAQKINEKIIKQSSTANIKARVDAATANSPSSFSRKDFKIGAGGSGKTEDQAAKEFADKEALSQTGVWEFDLGYALGNVVGKIQEQKRAIAKERKNFQPIDKIPKTKLKSSSGQSSILASGLRNVSEYHSPSPSEAKTKNTTKNKRQQRKDLKQKIAGIKTEVTNRPKINYGSVTNKKEAKGLPTKGKYGI